MTNFLKNISEDVPLEIFGDGMQTRDFVCISDVIEAFYCAIRNIEAKRGEVYNIGSGSATSINELASLLISSKEKDPQVIHKPLPPLEVCQNLHKRMETEEHLHCYTDLIFLLGLTYLSVKPYFEDYFPSQN